MRILAIDACLGRCSAALVDNGAALAVRSEAMQRGHVERLPQLVEDLFEATGVRPRSLGRIATTIGPGGFTGTRIGPAYARALALALDIPAIGVTTLEALAAQTLADAGPVWVAIEAGRGGVYLQGFEAGAPLTEPSEVPLEDASRLMAAHTPLTLVGSAAPKLASALPGAALLPICQIDPLAVARLAQGSGRSAAALYLRVPDAKPYTPLAANH